MCVCVHVHTHTHTFDQTVLSHGTMVCVQWIVCTLVLYFCTICTSVQYTLYNEFTMCDKHLDDIEQL